ncbi:predicted protein [Naegleria gruberi]|uniref:Predicted protein n=1 Tax=Naegleria gruberi TaxID=5762 RepID=D2VNW0_NAEGR|nr:uncharacterized protein NAEGRDRAFT_70637 [Naegleria gruberi]EFC41488.1 predicted protein [Naegleria gruberi]|eukprot:XP_002674232.1 predicted protein [Naegleria gruberi strain NEG-M]
MVEGIFSNYPVRKKQLEEHPDQYLRSIVDFIEVESFKLVDIQIALVCDGMSIFDLSNSEKEQALHQRIRKRYEELTRRRNLFPIEDIKFGELQVSGIVDKNDITSKIKIVIVNNRVYPIETLIKKGEEFGSFVLCASILKAPPHNSEMINSELRNALFYSKLHNESSTIQIYNEESEQRKEFAPLSSSLYDKMYNRKPSENKIKGDRLNINQLINKSKEINGIKTIPKPQPKFMSSPKKKKLLNISLDKNQMKQLKFINQWEKKFILTSLKTENSLLLIAIDQHAADERVRMEMIQQNILDYAQQSPGPWVQPLSKQTLNSTKVEGSKTISLLKQNKDKLSKWYWNFIIIHEESTNAFLKLNTIPCLFVEKDSIELGFESMMSFLSELEFDSTCWYPKRVLELIQSKACRGAIMFGDVLSTEKCNQLLQQLSNCQLPFQCAHGRPSK